jgi:hypothetical protein
MRSREGKRWRYPGNHPPASLTAAAVTSATRIVRIMASIIEVRIDIGAWPFQEQELIRQMINGF